MQEAQFTEGFDYAERNLLSDDSHLWLDKKLIQQYLSLDGLRVLDFGCGMGGMTIWIAQQFDCHIEGYDIDKNHIEIATALQAKHGPHDKRLSFHLQNILEEPPEGKFDVIFMNDVAEHIAFPVLMAILEKLKGCLADDGILFVSFPPWESPWAAHLSPWVKIPWSQYLPKKYLMKLIEKHNRTLVGRHDLKNEYLELNHLTYNKLLALTSRAGFKEQLRHSHCKLNKLPGLSGVNFSVGPFKYLVTKELVIFTKQNSTAAAEMVKNKRLAAAG
ncbi:cyclopropane-fatty-acyl-phospholipid synthase family protein [Roseivirga sp. BDSF3-8]|uniref:SAM-dependent methyltransferase n=1 Tax=Roseivirga sp. BDSF3-8 TaxID=3241598 RepID=UPI003532280E